MCYQSGGLCWVFKTVSEFRNCHHEIVACSKKFLIRTHWIADVGLDIIRRESKDLLYLNYGKYGVVCIIMPFKQMLQCICFRCASNLDVSRHRLIRFLSGRQLWLEKNRIWRGGLGYVLLQVKGKESSFTSQFIGANTERHKGLALINNLSLTYHNLP